MRLNTVVAGQRLHLTPHAIERYCERFRHLYDPTEFELARFAHELTFLLRHHGTITSEPPWNLYVPDEETGLLRKTTCYVIVGNDICIPVEQGSTGLVGVTVLAKGSISELRRQNRNERKQARRERTKMRRQNESWHGERSPRWK